MKSRTISFKLKDPRDRDLMEWLEGLGDRERSFYIRQALRDWLEGRSINRGAALPEKPEPKSSGGAAEEGSPGLPPQENPEGIKELEEKLDSLEF